MSETTLIEYFKHAELFGSRGRARWKNIDPPVGADWDFVVFTDDPDLVQQLSAILTRLNPLRENEFGEVWVRAQEDVHLCIMPEFKRRVLLRAYEYQDSTGCTKEEMTRLIVKWTRIGFNEGKRGVEDGEEEGSHQDARCSLPDLRTIGVRLERQERCGGVKKICQCGEPVEPTPDLDPILWSLNCFCCIEGLCRACKEITIKSREVKCEGCGSLVGCDCHILKG